MPPNLIIKFSVDVWATINRNSAMACYQSVRSTPKFRNSTEFIHWVKLGAK